MGKKDIYIGNTRLRIKEKEVGGQFVEIENEKFYKIDNLRSDARFFCDHRKRFKSLDVHFKQWGTYSRKKRS